MTSIRKANLGDLNVLIKLLSNQFGEHEIELESELLHNVLETMLKNERLGFCMLAEKDGDPVGFAAIVFTWTLEHGGNVAWLEELYVLPELRNDGIGTQLVDAVIAETTKLGCRAIDLEVEEEHERAENLYKRKGFHLLSRRRWAKKLV